MIEFTDLNQWLAEARRQDLIISNVTESDTVSPVFHTAWLTAQDEQGFFHQNNPDSPIGNGYIYEASPAA